MSDVLLVIDPDSDLREEATAATAGEKVRVLHAARAEEAFARLERGWIDLILLSPEVPGADDFDIVPQLRRRLPGVPIAFAADGNPVELAAEALSRGVHETISRPLIGPPLRLLLHRSRDHLQTRRANGLLRRELRNALGDRPIIAASPAMIDVLESVERAAAGASPALLRGEPGTGKEAVARAVHVHSDRHEGPFVALSCRSHDDGYVASELFGRTRGGHGDAAPARRGLLVEARGGTLFLDEIGALPRSVQARLAEVMSTRTLALPDEEGTTDLDVRVLASTQRDLDREAKSGRFDDTLLAHFERGSIDVPALRDRREDIPLLADAMLARLALRHGRDVREIADSALEALTNYAWPGNLRELENALERASLVAAGSRLELRDLPEALQHGHAPDDADVWALRPARHAAETAAIRRALRATGGNRTHAARLLRISQRALLYKLKDYDIRD